MNPSRYFMLLLSLCLLGMSSFGCTTPPTAAPTIIPTITPPPQPTATTDARMLLGEASAVCEQAFASAITGGRITLPVLSLVWPEYDADNGWRVTRLPHISARSAGEVRTLVCILQSREQVATYSDGGLGYELTWKIRVATWPGGTVLSEQTWTGLRPPFTKWFTRDAYGSPPVSQFLSWVFDQTQVASVIVPPRGDLVEQIAPLPSWELLAVYDHLNGTAIWNTTTGTIQSIFEPHPYQSVDYLASSPIQSEIAFSTDGGGILLLDLSTGDTVTIKDPNPADGEYYLTYSPDGKILASWIFKSASETDFSIQLWDVTTHELLHTLVGHSDTIHDLVFSPDGKSIASTSADGTVRIWEIGSGLLEYNIPASEWDPEHLAYSMDGASLILIGPFITIILDTASGQDLRRLDIPADIFAYSAQTGLMAAGEDLDGDTIELWDTATGTRTYILELQTGDLTAIAISDNDRYLASGDEFGQILIWDTRSGQSLVELFGHTDRIRSLQFSPDGRTLLSWSEDGTIRFWDLE